MKRNLLTTTLILVALVSGCTQTGDKNFNDPNVYRVKNDPKSYDIIVIDGCQYIYRENNGYQQGPIFTHKGNCTNPFHLINKTQ